MKQNSADCIQVLQEFAWFCDRFPAMIQPGKEKGSELTPTEIRILLAIDDFSIHTTGELIRLTDWDKSLLSRFLNELDLKDMLEYRRRPDNRKFCDLQLTEKGRGQVIHFKQKRKQYILGVLEAMLPEKRELALQSMARLNAIFDETAVPERPQKRKTRGRSHAAVS